MYELMNLSGQEYVDVYAATQKKRLLAAAKSRLLRARRRLRARLAEACQLRFGEDGKICCFTPRSPATPGPSA